MFLHYPPTSIGEQESCFIRIAEEHGAEKWFIPTAMEKNGLMTVLKDM
jgi:hypothetical protein